MTATVRQGSISRGYYRGINKEGKRLAPLNIVKIIYKNHSRLDKWYSEWRDGGCHVNKGLLKIAKKFDSANIQ
jgi:hypothetical protein